MAKWGVAFSLGMVVAAFQGAFDLGGCGNGAAQPDDGTRVTAAIEGHPDALTQQAASVLMTGLSATEQDHLAQLDWNAATADTLIRDPAFLHAVTLLRDANLMAQNRRVTVGVAEAACPAAAKQNINDGIAVVRRSFGRAATAGAVCALLGAGALVCSAAAVIAASANHGDILTTALGAVLACALDENPCTPDCDPVTCMAGVSDGCGGTCPVTTCSAPRTCCPSAGCMDLNAVPGSSCP
jgi:hypothetical protein